MALRSYYILFLLLLAYLSQGQTIISGRVIHAETGLPLSGVNISVKNTFLGSSTDQLGTYKLSLPDNTNHLVFSYLGMISQEILVIGDSVLDVQMQPDLLMMEGIVVTAIGIEKEQKALGYSVQELQGKELRQVHNDNFLNSITGKVAGVQIQSSSGSAGSSSYITIRGASSIDGNNQPLFILDGVPISNKAPYTVSGGVDMSNRAMDINPDDIESISVLKGGAATALYGIRASNGAVVITTRKGSYIPGRKISTVFHSSLTFDKVSRLPGIQNKYGQGFYGQWMSGTPVSWGPRLDTCSYSRDPGLWQNPDFDVDGAIVSKNEETATGESVRIYDPYDFFRTAVSQLYSLELSGGSETASFLTSASYNNSEGVVPGNQWKRFTLKISGDVDLSKSFNLFGSASYIHSGGDRIQKGDNTSGLMLDLIRTPPTFNNAAGYELPDGSQRNYRGGTGYDNPYWTINKNKFSDNVDRIISFSGFAWHPLEWIRLDYRLGIDYYGDMWRNYFAIGSAKYPEGYIYLNNYNERIINSDLLLKVNRTLAKDWNAGITLGNNIFENYLTELSGTATGLEIPDFYNLKNTSDLKAAEYTSHVRRAAFFGVIDVDYKNMVYLSVTGRNEWSTTMPENDNSFFYPSVSLAWIFTELNPLKENKTLPFGKLRFSYAQVANDAEPYRTSTGYATDPLTSYYISNGLIFPLLGKSGFTLSNTLGNEDLKPEMTSTWEIGTDLRWLDNRIALDLTYFDQKHKDLLINVPFSGTTGYYFAYMNSGEMTSNGLEVVLGVQPVRTSSWLWEASFNFTRIRNKVKELAPGVNAFPLGVSSVYVAAYEGYPYQSFFGYDWLRDENGNMIINDDPGSPSFGFPTGNYDTLVYLGNYMPDWTLGWSNTVTWKNLSLSFLLDIKKGGMISNGTRGALYYFGNHEDQESREPDDLYVFEGVKQSDGSPNDIPVVKGANWHFFGEGSTFTGPGAPYVEDAGWIRLREISLSYEFDDKLLGNGPVKSLSVYISGRNLWLETKYTGIDPETSLMGDSNGQGLDYYNMPGSKGVTVGMRLGF